MTGDIRHFPALRLIVYLPPGYEARPRRRYPVFYLQDGQNLFDGETSFVKGEEWFVDETAESLIRHREIEPLIIVGIDNAGPDRIDEYTPTLDLEARRGGRAGDYLRFLVTRVKPFVDEQFRTRRRADFTAIGGSSLGGLLALHAGMTYPRVFGKLAVMSPSVWWDHEAILRELECGDRGLPQKIWLDIGSEEGPVVGKVRRLKALFESRQQTFHYEEAEGAAHNERAWAARVAPMLRYLFPIRAQPHPH